MHNVEEHIQFIYHLEKVSNPSELFEKIKERYNEIIPKDYTLLDVESVEVFLDNSFVLSVTFGKEAEDYKEINWDRLATIIYRMATINSHLEREE